MNTHAATIPHPTLGAWPRPRSRPITSASFVGLALAHIVLGPVLASNANLSTLHAFVILMIGVWCAAQARHRHAIALYAVAYLTTGEVLWRMTQAHTPWEYGKYSVILVMLVLLASRRPDPSVHKYAVAFLTLLAPAIALSLAHYGFGDAARQAISFNLSGPLALAVALVCFSSFRYDEIQIDRLLVALILPAISIASIAAAGIMSHSIRFGTEASHAASGGYGPNQVSAILGLGAAACLFLVLRAPRGHVRWILSLTATWLLAQAVLTFSRGGAFNFTVCIAVLGFHYLRSRRGRLSFVTLMVFAVLVGGQVVLPRLDAFTGGALSERFSSTSTTGRAELAEGDLDLWLRHPIFGTGAGVAAFKRHSAIGRPIAPHTEYTRLVAEHGTLGALALIVLLFASASLYHRAPTILTRAWVASLAMWTLAAMSHTAMRNAAVSVVFGLAAIGWQPRRTTNQGRASSIQRVLAPAEARVAAAQRSSR